MSHWKTILVPTDLSDCSRVAFRTAETLARSIGAHLVVVHVNPAGGPMVAYDEVLRRLESEEYRKKFDETLHHLRSKEGRVNVEYQVVQGDPVEQILKLAKETGADAIVIGTHGRGGLMHVLLGSVAEKLLRQAPCAVVAVRMPRPKAVAHHETGVEELARSEIVL